MATDPFKAIFTPAILQNLFPVDRSDSFFEALYGDAEEGAYDIKLDYQGYAPNSRSLQFVFNLSERPGKCLACHLTHGLPEVFSRHPVIGIADLVNKINGLLGGQAECGDWQLGSTQNLSRKLYGVPLIIKLR
ncbi:MAG: pancreas/duodenum homeobox protein 1 [Desulfobulbaceae bacterium]|nr:pancreas/duodenum homeobox protein 1 [Desulfobulbaceae bacterium]